MKTPITCSLFSCIFFFLISSCNTHPTNLLINTVPNGATVFLDEVEIGKTPLETNVDVGQHIILVKLFGYHEEKQVFYAELNKKYGSSIFLTPDSVKNKNNIHTKKIVRVDQLTPDVGNTDTTIPSTGIVDEKQDNLKYSLEQIFRHYLNTEGLIPTLHSKAEEELLTINGDVITEWNDGLFGTDFELSEGNIISFVVYEGTPSKANNVLDYLENIIREVAIYVNDYQSKEWSPAKDDEPSYFEHLVVFNGGLYRILITTRVFSYTNSEDDVVMAQIRLGISLQEH